MLLFLLIVLLFRPNGIYGPHGQQIQNIDEIGEFRNHIDVYVPSWSGFQEFVGWNIEPTPSTSNQNYYIQSDNQVDLGDSCGFLFSFFLIVSPLLNYKNTIIKDQPGFTKKEAENSYFSFLSRIPPQYFLKLMKYHQICLFSNSYIKKGG